MAGPDPRSGVGEGWWGDPGCYRVADGVHRIPLSMPNDGLRAVNVYALETDDGLVLVDGGWAVDGAMAELDAALASIGSSPADVTDVLVTHIHRDHYTFAVRLREKYGARVHLGRLERPGLKLIQELGNNTPASSLRELVRADAADLARRIEASTAQEPFDLDDWADPDNWLDPGPLAIGGRRLEAVHTPGHTKGHLVLVDRERGLLFSGDHVLPTITPSIGFELGEWDLPLEHYLASLELLLGRDDARLMPAHGHPTDSVHARVRALLDHHRLRFQQVLAVVDQAAGGVVAREVAERLLWTRREVPFADLDPFNRMIAICETIAHLDALVARGSVAATSDGGVDRFSRD
jgi:glyoxylase-like metal-dependent hydrolase (beta-lactamase superfamily II)